MKSTAKKAAKMSQVATSATLAEKIEELWAEIDAHIDAHVDSLHAPGVPRGVLRQLIDAKGYGRCKCLALKAMKGES
jgi:hypothetical protein